MTYPIPARDPRVHVFSVSDGGPRLAHQTYLSRLSEPADATPLTEAVGAPVDTTYAEVFAVADVKPMRLRDYLSQAHDIPAEELARDAGRLDALSGDVVVLAPRAVEGVEALNPVPELTPIGAYTPAGADDAPRPLQQAKSTGDTDRIATPGVATGTGPQRKRLVWIVLGALVLAALLVSLI